MRQVLYRSAYLLRHPLVAGIFLILAAGGYALTYLPLFEVPGYELGEALALGCGLWGGAIGIAAGRLERRLIGSVDPRPRRAVRLDRPSAAVWAAVSAAWLIQLAAVSVPIARSVFQTLWS